MTKNFQRLRYWQKYIGKKVQKPVISKECRMSRKCTRATAKGSLDEGFEREKRSFFMTTTVLSNTAIKQNDVKSMNLGTNTHTHT